MLALPKVNFDEHIQRAPWPSAGTVKSVEVRELSFMISEPQPLVLTQSLGDS